MKNPAHAALILAFVAMVIIVLSSCATPPLAPAPDAPLVHLTVGDGGFYVTTEDKSVIVAQGVPSSYFVLTPKGWYMTRQQAILAANICAANRNKGVWK
jgi:hypothetical protein